MFIRKTRNSTYENSSDPETANRRLWPMSRVAAWRVVKSAMLEAGVVGRLHARRAFATGSAWARCRLLLSRSTWCKVDGPRPHQQHGDLR
jgi:hypothetical protein